MVTASRSFVCIRPQTYESPTEADLLTALYPTRRGELVNTTFCLLAPDGEERLSESGRSPAMVFRSVDAFRSALEASASRHPGKDAGTPGLPHLSDLRRALNVAACDSLPLVIVTAQGKEREALESALAPLAWDEKRAGLFAYVRSKGGEALESITGRPKGASAALIVAPDAYGTGGEVLASITGVRELPSALDRVLREHDYDRPTERETRRHINAGKADGIAWESELPVTDPGASKGRGR